MVRDVKLTPAEKIQSAWKKYEGKELKERTKEACFYGGAVFAMGTIAMDIRKVFLAAGLDFRPKSEAAQLLATIDQGIREGAKRIAKMADTPTPPPETEP